CLVGSEMCIRDRVIADNYLFVQELLRLNVNKLVRNKQLMIPLDLAHKMGWSNIVNLLK
ncbi:hypothetical protein ACN6PZ_12450, partial [Acinetobacter baumannii]